MLSKTVEEIAAACETHPRGTEKLLSALSGCGYFTYQNGRYAWNVVRQAPLNDHP